MPDAPGPAGFLGAPEYLDGMFDTAEAEGFVVDSVDRLPSDSADEVRRRAGWLG